MFNLSDFSELPRWIGAEFLGTFFLILLGNGAGSQLTLNKMFAKESKAKLLTAAFAWGIAVLVGVLIANSLFEGAGNINPAVSLFYAVSGTIQKALYPLHVNFSIPLLWVALLLAWVAQFAGAMLAQALLNFLFWKHIEQTDPQSVLVTHCTNPAIFNIPRNFATEFVATSVLIASLLVADSFGANRFDQSPRGVVPMLVVTGLIMSFGAATGTAINPARDLGPRIVYWLSPIKNKDPNLKYSWIPVAAPLSASVILGVLVAVIV